MTDRAPNDKPSQPPVPAGEPAGSHDDTFTIYVVQRLLPFAHKHLWLLILAALIVVGTVAGVTIGNSRARAAERKVLNDIYTTLDQTKEIDLGLMETLNTRYTGIPAALEVRWRLAGEYVRTGAFDKAAPVYRAIIAADDRQPIAVQAALALGSCLEQASDLDGAIKAYKAAAAAQGQPRIRAYLGYRTALVHFQKQDFDGTEREANRALGVLESAPAETRLRMFDRDLAGRLEYLRNLSTAKLKKNG
ncbi:MAG: tetratricopeptide repeat protein [Planctomycetota bacterium]